MKDSVLSLKKKSKQHCDFLSNYPHVVTNLL